MKLHEFLDAYQENRKDIFAVCSEDEEEMNRFSMIDYYLRGFSEVYDDCRIVCFTVDAINRDCLLFTFVLDVPNPNADDGMI